jgi:hypothetical protein
MHAHEAAPPQARLATLPIAEAQLAHDHRVAEVVRVAVGEQLDVGEPDGLAALDAQG